MRIGTCDTCGFLRGQAFDPLVGFEMVFHPERFAVRVHPVKGMAAEPVHVTEARRDTTVTVQPGEHVGHLGAERKEVPHVIGFLAAGVRIALLRMNEVREFFRVPDEKDRRIVTNQIVVAFFGVEFDGKAARVTHGIGVTLFSGHRGKSDEQFGALADRIEVVTDGIPVAAIPFAPDPATIRTELAMRPGYRSLNLRADRSVVGQIDYFHPSKAMLTTLRMFRDSGIWRMYDLVLAGGPGWQLQDRVSPGRPSYLTRIRAFVTDYGLEDRVRVLGPLPGSQVAELYGAMDLSISPVRLEDPPALRDPESYGQGRAVANAAGTPVLMSDAYDPSFAADPDLLFGDVEVGTERLHDFVSSAAMRRQVRAFAEQRDTMIPGLARYAAFIGLLSDQASLKAAVKALVAAETDLASTSESYS